MSINSRWVATTGWDAASGLGRIYGDKFMAAVVEPPGTHPTPPPGPVPTPPPVTPPTAAQLVVIVNKAIMDGLTVTGTRFKFPWASVKSVLASAAKDTQSSVDKAIVASVP